MRIQSINQPQDRLLVLVLPTEEYDLGAAAVVGIARGVMWWEPGSPVPCKLVNRSNYWVTVSSAPMIARMIAVNSRDSTRFQSLFDTPPSTMDPQTPPSPPPPPPAAVPSNDVVFPLKVEDTNLGQLGHTEKGQLTKILQGFLTAGLFPSDPKRVPACVGGELTLPLKDELCAPVTETAQVLPGGA